MLLLSSKFVLNDHFIQPKLSLVEYVFSPLAAPGHENEDKGISWSSRGPVNNDHVLIKLSIPIFIKTNS